MAALQIRTYAIVYMRSTIFKLSSPYYDCLLQNVVKLILPELSNYMKYIPIWVQRYRQPK